MKNILWLVSLAALALLFLSGCAVVSNDGNRIIAGGDYVLHSGETWNGNLLILGGNSTLEQDSRLNGNLSVIGGNTDANGEMDGNIWIVGGNVDLGPKALVRGAATVDGGNLSRAPGAQITGGVTTSRAFESSVFQGPVVVPALTITPRMIVGWLLARSLLLALLALVVVLIWSPAVERTAHAVVEQPVGAGLLGLAVMVLTPVVLVVFAITLIGIPVAIVLAVAAMVALVFGWIALGLMVGQRLDDALKLKLAPALRAAVGTFVLVVVIGALDWIPVVGWLLTAVVSALALGGVVLTRFGSRTYTASPGQTLPPALPQGGQA